MQQKQGDLVGLQDEVYLNSAEEMILLQIAIHNADDLKQEESSIDADWLKD